ncbi:MAG: hypothetical protein ACK5P7_11530 [Bdellovibrio sp.]|jgi:hypothetical protein
MKSWKLFWTVVFVGSFLTMGLTACGKKEDNKNTSLNYGSLSSDGQTVTSNSTLGGAPLNLQIRNVQTLGTYGARFDLSVNGAYQMVSQSSPQFSNWQQVSQYGSAVMMAHASACTDAACSTVYVTVAVYSTYGQCGYGSQCQYDIRQYAVKRTNGKVSGLREWNLGSNTYGIQSIQAIMGTF